jgi:hypothetical protein
LEHERDAAYSDAGSAEQRASWIFEDERRWWDAERHRLAEAGKELATILKETLYAPPDYAGPPVWWDEKARAALAKWAAAL